MATTTVLPQGWTVESRARAGSTQIIKVRHDDGRRHRIMLDIPSCASEMGELEFAGWLREIMELEILFQL